MNFQKLPNLVTLLVKYTDLGKAKNDYFTFLVCLGRDSNTCKSI